MLSMIGQKAHHLKVGLLYRALRGEARLTLREVAADLGVSVPAISQIEHGDRRVPGWGARSFSIPGHVIVEEPEPSGKAVRKELDRVLAYGEQRDGGRFVYVVGWLDPGDFDSRKNLGTIIPLGAGVVAYETPYVPDAIEALLRAMGFDNIVVMPVRPSVVGNPAKIRLGSEQGDLDSVIKLLQRQLREYRRTGTAF